ncbi:MAG TPA: RNA polymerase sigma-70 factor, partial [Prevotella sp.]
MITAVQKPIAYNNESLLSQDLSKGVQQAFVFLFDTYYKSLVDYAWRILHDEDTAQDIVQSVFLKFYENHEAFSFSPPLKPYFYRTVYNKCLNEMRRQRIVNKYADNNLLNFYLKEVLQTPKAEMDLQGKEIMQYIHEAVSHLPERCREIYELKYDKSLSNKEIAQQLNISVKTVEAQTT